MEDDFEGEPSEPSTSVLLDPEEDYAEVNSNGKGVDFVNFINLENGGLHICRWLMHKYL